nr:ABC transporter ATP-binding protein [Frankia sp. QA3]
MTAVSEASLAIGPRELVALVGESGSGKSTVALALLGLLGATGRVTGGSIRLRDRELVGRGERELRRLRGVEIGYVPQDPMTSLNPVQRVGVQVAETLVIHGLAKGAQAHARALDALADAGLRDPEEVARRYPHELSGGMRQRVLIATALVARPALIVADEPTSALDVTVQRQILDNLDALRARLGIALLLITHDLGLAAERADRVVVFYAGRTVEAGPASGVLSDPRHPYTAALAGSAPRLAGGRRRLAGIEGAAPNPLTPATGCLFAERCTFVHDRCRAEPPPLMGTDHAVACWLSEAPPRPALTPAAPRQPASAPELLRVEGLTKDFVIRRGTRVTRVRAVDEVSFAIGRGETLGLVGESGSGKSTTARIILRLLEPTAGRVLFDDHDLTALHGERLRQARRRVQPVFQDPLASLDPRFTIEQLIEEPLRAFSLGSRAERRARAAEMLELVRLPASLLGRRAGQLSGGQRQRVAIARALVLGPELVVCDEAVSALDVSVQAQILNLLGDLQRELGVSLLFISHDLALVRHIADRVCVMREGRVVEAGDSEAVLLAPEHPYTRELVAAVPDLDAGLAFDAASHELIPESATKED